MRKLTDELDLYAAGQIVGHASDEDSGADVGVSVGLGDGRMLYIGEASDSLLEEHGASCGGTGGHWLILFGKDHGSTQVLGKAVDGLDAQAICLAVAARLLPLTPAGREALATHQGEQNAV